MVGKTHGHRLSPRMLGPSGNKGKSSSSSSQSMMLMPGTGETILESGGFGLGGLRSLSGSSSLESFSESFDCMAESSSCDCSLCKLKFVAGLMHGDVGMEEDVGIPRLFRLSDGTVVFKVFGADTSVSASICISNTLRGGKLDWDNDERCCIPI